MDQITSVAARSKRRVPASFTEGSSSWNMTLRYQGRSMRVPFYMGPALKDEPTGPEVLDSLISDAHAWLSSSSVEEFAHEFGYELEEASDRRRASASWRECHTIHDRLAVLLGDDFEKAMDEGAAQFFPTVETEA